MRVEVTLDNDETMILFQSSSGWKVERADSVLFDLNIFNYSTTHNLRPNQVLGGTFVSLTVIGRQWGMAGTWELESKVASIKPI